MVMSIDTRDERASCLGAASPWRFVLPNPDGAIGQGDRQQLAFVYVGILSAEPDEPVEPEVLRPPIAVTGRRTTGAAMLIGKRTTGAIEVEGEV
jgi:hypothetical protein